MAKKLTPLMKQYWEIKSQYPDTILLFRIGDFYETFGEDARIASQVLGIVLTKRHSGAAADEDLAGFPHHSLDTYLPRLVRAGYRVAICEQLEDPKLAKTIVKRGVTAVSYTHLDVYKRQLLDGLIPYCRDLLYAGHLIAELDVLTNFAHIAIINDYKRPVLTDDLIIDIDQGRHPVIEKMLKAGERYIPNDLYLDTNNQQIIVLTGPNMAGKSAFLRQTALIVIMAQMGSFVPANKAIIGIVDKLFTRVGASDNISLGESTFMMEMNETASILNNLSERSLILLDEIGRGTSTFDGISIAMAIIEYLHNHPYYRPKTIFATHYHELNEVANYLERVKNFHFSVKEIDNKIIFLRKLEEGGTEHSFRCV